MVAKFVAVRVTRPVICCPAQTKSRLTGATGRDGELISGFSSCSQHHRPQKEKSITLLMHNTLFLALQRRQKRVRPIYFNVLKILFLGGAVKVKCGCWGLEADH